MTNEHSLEQADGLTTNQTTGHQDCARRSNPRTLVRTTAFLLLSLLFVESAAATTYTFSGGLSGAINGTPILPGATLAGTADDATGEFNVTYSNLSTGVPDQLKPYMRPVVSFAFAKETGGAKNGWNYMDHSVNAFLAYVRDSGDGVAGGQVTQNVDVQVRDLATNTFWVNVTMVIDGFVVGDSITGTQTYSENLTPITPASGTVEGLTATDQRTVDTTGGPHEQTWNTEIMWLGDHPIPTILTVVPGYTYTDASTLTVQSTITVSPFSTNPTGVPTVSQLGLISIATLLLGLGSTQLSRGRRK